MKNLKELQLLLEKCHAHFNDLYCGGVLGRCMIGIFPKGTKRANGWFWQDKWQETEDKLHEICITAENLNRPYEDILETMLHEMAHQYNHEAGVEDCNRQGRHNKQFKKAAESIFFLECEKSANKGYNVTSLTDRSRKDIEDFCKGEGIQSADTCPLVRTTPTKKEKETKKDPTKNIQVSENDYETFKQWREKNGLLPKLAFAKLLEIAGAMDPVENISVPEPTEA